MDIKSIPPECYVTGANTSELAVAFIVKLAGMVVRGQVSAAAGTAVGNRTAGNPSLWDHLDALPADQRLLVVSVLNSIAFLSCGCMCMTLCC